MEFISHSGAEAGRPNAHRLSWSEGSLLLDCGGDRRKPGYPATLERPDAVWISHAHGDHCGAILELLARWPRLPVLATQATIDLLPFALGAAGTSKRRAARIAALCRRITAVPWRRFRPLPGVNGGQIMALPAGHISGAAMALVDLKSAGQRRRILYTGDFCTHDQAVVTGAGIPLMNDGVNVDMLISEAILATDREADTLVWKQEAQALVEVVEEADGPVLIAVASIGESLEVAALLAGAGVSVMVDEYLEKVLEIGLEAGAQERAFISFGDRRRLKGRLRADGVIIAPGDQYRRGTSAAALAGALIDDCSATLVVLNRARKKTGAGRLIAGARGDEMNWQGRRIQRQARVVHRRLLNHAPRWQLKAFIQGVGAPMNLLVHGTTGARWGLKRALIKEGLDDDKLIVVEAGRSYELEPKRFCPEP